MGTPERDIAQAEGFIALPGHRRHRPEAVLLYQPWTSKRFRIP